MRKYLKRTLHYVIVFVLSVSLAAPLPTRTASAQAQQSIPIKAEQIAAGLFHSLALTSDGTVVAWGNNQFGQTTVPLEAQSDIIAIAAGGNHSLALKSGGSVIAWGDNGYGQTIVPLEAQSDVIAIAAGAYHSLTLKSDGSVVAWGDNQYGQTIVPLEAQSNVIAIAAGAYHSLALKFDGTVVAWGDNEYGQTTVPLESQSNVIAIAAGGWHSLALKSDGSVVAWGFNDFGPTTVPIAAQSDIIAIVAGVVHSLALRSDGSVIAWGSNDFGQTTVPIAAQSDIIGIAAGGFHSLALRSDGSIVAWGDDQYGQTTVPGSATLSGLSWSAGEDQGSLSVSDQDAFDINASKSTSIKIKATMTDPDHGDVYINDAKVESGSPVDVPLVGADTEIHVRVEPYLLPGKTHTIAVHRDAAAPEIHFETNGGSDPAKAVSSKVAVTDEEAGVDEDSLQYVWTQSAALPDDGWSPFENGDALTKSGGDGNWYLHIQATDLAGNVADAVSAAFLLDNTAPELVLEGSNPLSIPQGGTFADPGATATDAMDGSIPGASIIASGSVDTSVMGTYPIEYQVSDRAGNTVSVTRSVYVYDGDAPAILLNGPNTMTVEAGSTFTDPGATANDVQDGDLTSSIMITGSVDTSTIGTYLLQYDVTDQGNNAAPSVTRTVYVADTKAPIITLQGESTLTVPYGSTFTDPGATANDVQDGDLTSSIVISGTVDTSTIGSYVLQYDVTDQASNAAPSVTRTVHVVDTRAPIITLQGEAALTVPYGSTFTDPGASAFDQYDGDVSASIVVTGTVDTEHAGTYTLQYDAADHSGNQAEPVIRTISVPTRSLPSTPSGTEVKPSDPVPESQEPPAAKISLYMKGVDVSSFIQRLTDLLETDSAGSPAPFPDTTGHWAAPAIVRFSRLGVVNGYMDHKFYPENFITRAEFASILSRIFDFNVNDLTNTYKLSDIADNWAKDAIQKLLKARLLTGYDNGTFEPNQPITREEIAVILSRLLNDQALEKDVSKSTFKDSNQVSSFAKEAVTELAAAGIIHGKPDGNFDPRGSASRAETLTMLWNILYLDPDIRSLGMEEQGSSKSPY